MAPKSPSPVAPYQVIQEQFASYIRDPAINDVPTGVEQRRMDIYKRLFFNNISSFCTKAFKSFRPFVNDTEWNALIRGFMREHACTSPYFKDIPLSFVDYLSGCEEMIDQYPFVQEICHLDAIRMQLRLAPDAPKCMSLQISETSTRLRLSPTVHLLSYAWPVHKLTPSNWTRAKPKASTWLIAFRGPNDRVEVLVTNAHTFRMLEILNDPKTVKSLSNQLSREFKVGQTALLRKLIPTIHALQKKGILLTESP